MPEVTDTLPPPYRKGNSKLTFKKIHFQPHICLTLRFSRTKVSLGDLPLSCHAIVPFSFRLSVRQVVSCVILQGSTKSTSIHALAGRTCLNVFDVHGGVVVFCRASHAFFCPYLVGPRRVGKDDAVFFQSVPTSSMRVKN